MLSVESTNTNFIVFGLSRLALEPTIYHTRGKHDGHYTNDAVQVPLDVKILKVYRIAKIYLWFIVNMLFLLSLPLIH